MVDNLKVLNQPYTNIDIWNSRMLHFRSRLLLILGYLSIINHIIVVPMPFLYFYLWLYVFAGRSSRTLCRRKNYASINTYIQVKEKKNTRFYLHSTRVIANKRVYYWCVDMRGMAWSKERGMSKFATNAGYTHSRRIVYMQVHEIIWITKKKNV